MEELRMVSGRMNPGIDPVLEAWHFEIPLYLFLGGLVAGILCFASYYYLRGKEETYPTAVKFAPMITPVLLGIGLLFLFIDLTHKLYFWRLYTTIRLESPMSWGAWVLMLVTPLSLLWCLSWMGDVFPRSNSFLKPIQPFINLLIRNRKPMAIAMGLFSLLLGMYTGILLSAFNARPFWNTSILGPIFLVSGLSTGAAMTILLSRDKEEKHKFATIDLALITIEFFLIIHMFMGFLASTEVQIQAAKLFLGGPFTWPFWGLVVLCGLLVPALLEAAEIKGWKIPKWLPAVLVLFGGLLLRFIVVDAGQASRWLY